MQLRWKTTNIQKKYMNVFYLDVIVHLCKQLFRMLNKCRRLTFILKVQSWLNLKFVLKGTQINFHQSKTIYFYTNYLDYISIKYFWILLYLKNDGFMIMENGNGKLCSFYDKTNPRVLLLCPLYNSITEWKRERHKPYLYQKCLNVTLSRRAF